MLFLPPKNALHVECNSESESESSFNKYMIFREMSTPVVHCTVCQLPEVHKHSGQKSLEQLCKLKLKNVPAHIPQSVQRNTNQVWEEGMERVSPVQLAFLKTLMA